MVDIESASAHQLQRSLRHKHWVVDQVPLPESSWFLEEAVQPLQPELLYPTGTVFQPSSVEVECSAHADH